MFGWRRIAFLVSRLFGRFIGICRVVVLCRVHRVFIMLVVYSWLRVKRPLVLAFILLRLWLVGGIVVVGGGCRVVLLIFSLVLRIGGGRLVVRLRVSILDAAG